MLGLLKSVPLLRRRIVALFPLALVNLETTFFLAQVAVPSK